ncbi:MAG: translocation/assembly module TamB domain-containing protein, partial [Pseudomonadota bacterium]
QTGQVWDVAGVLASPDLEADFDVAADLSTDVPALSGTIAASAASLAPFSARAGRPLAGGLTLDVAGSLTADLTTFDLAGDLTGQDLAIGQADADRLLAGTVVLAADLARDGDAFDVTTLSIDAPELQLAVTGDIAPESGTLDISARLADIGPYAAGFSGPATVDGTVGRIAGGDWQVDLSAVGPNNGQINVAGTVAEDAETADVTVQGAAPLALANRFIAPRTVSGILNFDLALNGAPGLDAISGRVTTANARAASPGERIVLSDIDTAVTLGGGRASLDFRAAGDAGGGLSITGPVTLAPPYNGALELTLNRFVLRDPALYRTSVDGSIRLDGPLAGGASIAGQIVLDETEIQIPSGSLSRAGSIPDIVHRNEPAAVRATRARAGLIAEDTDSDATGGAGPAFPLDVSVVAANQIFIRGRGLESELGGSLRLRGTTADIIPEGQFDLIRGRLDILNRRLELTEGRATLEGDFDPTLYFVAETDADDVTVQIVVEGRASEPEISFQSDPDLPEDEVLARLLFGRGLDTLSPLQAAQLASAVAQLAGTGGEGIVSRLRRNFGLDDLDVTTDDSGNVAVRAGAYLSDNVYTDVTVGGEGQTEVNLNLDVSSSVTVKGGVDNEGETGVGIFFERDY